MVSDGTIRAVLERLRVRGLAIIDEVELDLEPGFVALTGETGAGKSLLVESLKLLAGQRAQTDMVRTGEDRLRVEGFFAPGSSPELEAALAELGVDADEELVVRREVAAEGRSRCWLNDVPVTAGALQRIAPQLLSIHGQHEQYGLAEPAVQRELVDRFGGLEPQVDELRGAWRRWRDARDGLEALRTARTGRRDRLDAIAFQLAEIDGVDPSPGEDRDLRQRRQLLRHAVRVMELSGAVLGRLSEADGSAVEALAKAERELREMASCGLAVVDAAGRLGEARVVVEEVVRELQGMTADVAEDPAELEQVESRLHRLEQLLLKYGATVDEVRSHRERLLEERAELEAVEERIDEAAAAERQALDAYDAVARRLEAARTAAGRELAAEVGRVLDGLAMGGTRLDLDSRCRPDPSSPLVRGGRPVAFGPDGVEEYELLIAPNPGEEPRPMARIASGGELSRIHLALRTVLRRRSRRGALTLLFDEVDSGLGGGAAAALAELLASLAEVDQVVVVTHLPQVAARAASHHRVDKRVAGERTVTRVTTLGAAARVEELARMLSGDRLTDAARAHARELLERS